MSKAVRTAVTDQFSAGIESQVRDNMNRAFISLIQGFFRDSEATTPRAQGSH